MLLYFLTEDGLTTDYVVEKQKYKKKFQLRSSVTEAKAAHKKYTTHNILESCPHKIVEASIDRFYLMIDPH